MSEAKPVAVERLETPVTYALVDSHAKTVKGVNDLIEAHNALVESCEEVAALYAEDRQDLLAVIREVSYALLLGAIIALGIVIRDVQDHHWIDAALDAGLTACFVGLWWTWSRRAHDFTIRPFRMLAERSTPTPEENTP